MIEGHQIELDFLAKGVLTCSEEWKSLAMND